MASSKKLKLLNKPCKQKISLLFWHKPKYIVYYFNHLKAAKAQKILTNMPLN